MSEEESCQGRYGTREMLNLEKKRLGGSDPHFPSHAGKKNSELSPRMNWGSMDERCQRNIRKNFVIVRLDLAAWWGGSQGRVPHHYRGKNW